MLHFILDNKKHVELRHLKKNIRFACVASVAASERSFLAAATQLLQRVITELMFQHPISGGFVF